MRNKFLELLLFIDSLFSETATLFLIPGFNKNFFICRSTHFIKCFRKTVLKVSIYPKKLKVSDTSYGCLENVFKNI